MSTSSRLALPFLAAGQAQKHVTVNESLIRLDALVQISVESASLAAEPGAPADGALYVLPAGKTGTHWGAMTEGALAYWRDGAWEELAPHEGWLAFDKAEGRFLRYDGAGWTPLLGLLTHIDASTGWIGLGTDSPAGMVHLSGFGGAASILLDSYSSGAASGGLHGRRARGLEGEPEAVQAGDALMIFGGRGYGASGFSSGTRANIGFYAAETWSDAAQGAYIVLRTTPVGAAATVEALRIGADQRLIAGGPVQPKSYTVATVPSASAAAGQIIYVSDETGGAVLAFSDGTDWRRVTDRAVVS